MEKEILVGFTQVPRKLISLRGLSVSSGSSSPKNLTLIRNQENYQTKKFLALLNIKQILYDIMYAKHPYIFYTKVMSDLHISLLIRVQLSFSRVLRNIRVGTAVFTFVLHVVVVLERDDWYETTPIWGWDSPVIQLDKKQIGQVISNNSHFYSIVERPTDFFLRTSRKSSLNLGGFYSRKESCGAYGKGPFYLIREERYRPRAVLLLSLVCLGNFTVGEAEDGSASTAKYNKNRDKEIFTYREQVNIYMHRQRTQFSPTLYVTTIKQGYSFITCFSTEDLSFKHT